MGYALVSTNCDKKQTENGNYKYCFSHKYQSKHRAIMHNFITLDM